MILNQVDPPAQLCGNILAKIENEQKRTAKIKAAFSGLLALASFIAAFPAAGYILQGLQSSGFYQFASLVFTDGGTIFSYYFKEFALSLAESVPVLELSIFLTVLFILMISFKFLIKNVRVAFLSTQFN